MFPDIWGNGSGEVKDVAWSIAGLLASGSADHTVKIWNPSTGECSGTRSRATGDRIVRNVASLAWVGTTPPPLSTNDGRTSRRHRLPVGGYEAVSNASCVCARYLGPQQGHQDVGPHGHDAGRPRGGLAGGLCSGLRLHKRRPVPVLTLQRPTVLLVWFLLRQR